MTSGERILVIGTAGHVDHGKSALVRALTGTDPDRLAEEQARGLTIDLGFAWRRLAGLGIASFVDVPGHEDFIRNMLSGVGGVDAAMLVVAADEGPMPQTLEHLAILDLLGIANGLAVLTKADLVEPDWVELMTQETRRLLDGTVLATAAILAVSAQAGTGMDALVAALGGLLADAPSAPDRGRARLAVDRAFSLAGFGTVVTGTLRDGSLAVGDALEVWPSGLRTRARGLHAYGQSAQRVGPGTRTAINLVGLSTDEVQRGDIVTVPGAYAPSSLVDVHVTLLEARDKGAGRAGRRVASRLPGRVGGRPLAHDDSVNLFHGAAELPARVRLIGQKQLLPGESGDAQLVLARPTVLSAGDRFVLRLPSPSVTLGGGVVLDPHPTGRRRRFRQATLDHFTALQAPSPAERLLARLAERGPCRVDALTEPDTGIGPQERDLGLAELAEVGRVKRLGEWWLTTEAWQDIQSRIRQRLEEYHKAQPLHAGAPTEAVRTQMGLPPEVFAAAVAEGAARGWLVATHDALRLATHLVAFGTAEQTAIEGLLARFRAAPFTPPSQSEAEAVVAPKVLAALVRRGDLVSVGGGVLFDREAYDALLDGVKRTVAARGQITVADLRDQFVTSRKYALALLEHLDRIRFTRRVGDARVLMAASGEVRSGEASGGKKE